MKSFNEEDARRFYRWLTHQPDEYTEIRIIKWPPPGEVKQFWVQNEKDFIKICKTWSGKRQVYCGLNPRLREGGTNEDVARVIAIPLDIDSFRPSKDVAVSEEELAATKDRMIKINSWMRVQGYQQPFIAMSGNGFHILQRLDITLTEELTAGDLSSKLESYFFNEVPGSDKMDKILDASRIIKVPGTLSVKGVPTEERPHRLSYILNEGSPESDTVLVDHIQSLELYTPDVKIYTPIPITKTEETKKRKTSRLLPCFKRFAEEGGRLADVGSEDNLLRLALVAEAHAKGYSREEILELFTKADDYNPKTTAEKVDHQLGKLAVKGQKKWRCKAIHKHGGCLGKTCKRYKKHVDKYLDEPEMQIEEESRKELMSKVLNLLEQNYVFATPDDVEQLYLYENGVYIQGETIIKEGVEEILGDDADTGFCNEAINHFKRRSYVKRDVFNKFEGEVPVLNGLLNLETMQLRDFDPKKIFTFKINTKFSQGKDAPKFKAVLKQILPEADERALLQENAGYILWPEFPHHKFMIFIGTGRNGKGVIIRTLEGIIGKKNISNIRLEHLSGGHRFMVANLFGKLMNVCSEPSTRRPFKTELLKQITGQDTVDGEIKNKQTLLKFTPFAKFFVQANKLPLVDDITLSFWDRINIIAFTKTFTDEQKNKILDIEKTWLDDEDERSGVLNWMIEGLKRLKENGAFTQTKSRDQTILTFKRVSDPIGAFLTDPEECMYGSILWVTRSDLYDAYKEYAEIYGVAIESNGVFTARMKKLPGIKEGWRTKAGKNQRSWLGLSVLQKTPPPVLEEFA